MGELDLDMENTKGIVYNIQRFSIHDGPGIRTIVFLKGCPLRCKWCSNPESQQMLPEMMGDELIGKEVTVKEVMDQVLKDVPFYDESGGGLTLSGGEPLLQSEFARNLVLAAKQNNIHVAIETTLHQEWDVLWEVVQHIDYIMFDIKFIDEKKHKKHVGGDLGLIKNNIEKLVEKDVIYRARTPLIPYYNDDKESIDQLGEFCFKVGIKALDLLPYHRLGESKYDRLNRSYALKGILPLNPEDAINIAGYLKKQYEIDAQVI